MDLYYTTEFNEKKAVLKGQEASHCSRVRRHRPGDLIRLTNGLGTKMTGQIATVQKTEVVIDVLEYTTCPYDKHVLPTIAISIIKNPSRFEWLVEKITEIGVERIIPLICHRTEKKSVRLDRLERIAISALKQSEGWYKPHISSPVTFTTFVEEANSERKFIASYSSQNAQLSDLKPKPHTTVLIGPEGDFTNEEIETAKQNGFQRVNLGSNRLRVETAGMVACVLTNDPTRPQ